MLRLSKSKYTNLWQCPKMLWMKAYKPEEQPPIDAATQAVFDTGHEVGDLARELPENKVFDLYSLRSDKKWALYDKGNVSFEDLLESGCKLSEIQRLQIDHAIHPQSAHIDADGIRQFLDSLSYPLHFLDFETMGPAIPIIEGSKAFDRIVFQYSLHYVECEGGELKHKEFLAESGEDPRRSVAEALCRDIPEDACVIVYNQSFERSVIKALAGMFPDLSEHLMTIWDNIVDLLVPFKSGCYYNRAMGGSFSIKSVLPAVFPDDPELDYNNLEGIHNGDEAKNIFPKIKDMTSEDAEKTRHELLEYCKLDTYAMVKLWQELVRVTE